MVDNMNTIEQIEANIKEARALIARKEQLDRLCNNKDFKDIIGDGYFKEEAIRLVHIKNDANMQRPEVQERIMKSIDAIGILAGYINEIGRKAETAEMIIADGQEAINEIMNEEE